jgi:ABC-type transport system involved in multi-copper enzyme maturation permease subunit
MRSVRSTKWSFGVIIFLGIGLSILATTLTTANYSHMSLVDRATFDPTQTSLIGIFFGQFAIGVIGVMVMSSEYSTGTIRVSLAAVPKRSRLLLAKAIVFGASALIVGEIVAFLSFLIGQAFLRSPLPHATLSSPGALRAVTEDGLYLCLLGLLALGLGAILRSTPAAVSTYVSLLLILPIIIGLLPTPIPDDVQRFLPLDIGHSIVARVANQHDFSPGVGLIFLVIYTLVSLCAGGLLLIRRDA